MKNLVAAVKAVYQGVVHPLDEAFERYRTFDEGQAEGFKGTREEHTLLQASFILRKDGCYFGSPKDRKDFDSLVGILKRCPEVNHEGVHARRPRAGKGAVRVRHRQGRALSPQA